MFPFIYFQALINIMTMCSSKKLVGILVKPFSVFNKLLVSVVCAY